MFDVQVYTSGLVHCSVCAPVALSREQVEEQVNAIHPTGIESRWKVSDDKAFKGGEPNPCRCDTDDGRQHWLMVC